MRWAALTLLLTASASLHARAQGVRPEVVRRYPHDPEAFTQGLLWHGGALYESTGLRGRSSLRRVKLESGEIQQQHALPSSLFGEGLARVGDRLLQLTWQSGVALEYQLANLETTRRLDYEGEGWGLCYDGERLVMSDGTARLSFRDPQTFEVTGHVDVTHDGRRVPHLNELECVGRLVYANVWQTDYIVRIDPDDGTVLTTIDASGLLSPPEAAAADVLNGIAYNPERKTFYLTGKLWPALFEVRFDFEAGQANPPAAADRTARPASSASGEAQGEDDEPAARSNAAPEQATGGGCRLGCQTSQTPSAVLSLWLAPLLIAARRRARVFGGRARGAPRAD